MAKSPRKFLLAFIASGGILLISPEVFGVSIRNNNYQSNIESSVINLDLISDEKYSGLYSSTSLEDSSSDKIPLELRLQSDKQTYDSETKIFVAEGNVILQIEGGILKANRIEFDRNFETFIATGRVRLRKGNQYFQATQFSYNLIDKQGELFDVYGLIDLEYLDQDLKLVSYENKLSESNYPPLKHNPEDLIFNNEKIIDTNFLTDKTYELYPLTCSPFVPLIPDWQPFPWAGTIWMGQMTDSEFGEAFTFQGTPRQEYLFGIGINKRIYRSGPISIELDGNILAHNYEAYDNFAEGTFGLGVRLWVTPWLNFGVIEGVSYTTSISNYERTKRDKSANFLNYLGFEIETLLTDQLSLVGRIHHRSGVYGLYSGVEEGSNGYLLGFRYRWGEDNNQSLPPPSELIDCSLYKLHSNSLEDNDSNNHIEFELTDFKEQVNPSLEDIYSDYNMLLDIDYQSLSNREKEELREDVIALIDQRIISLNFKKSLTARFNIGSSFIYNEEYTRNEAVSQLSAIGRSRILTGSISRWRVQSPHVILNPNGWSAEIMNFSNDPLTPTQVRIESKNVLATEEIDNQILITSTNSQLILEERLKLPMINSLRISDKEEERWVFDFDFKDRDGLFVGRVIKPFEIGSDFELTIQPQFMIQRSLNGETSSYVELGRSDNTEKVTASTSWSDLFGLKAKLKGKSFDWDVRLKANISTFNPERLGDGTRYWGNMRRDFDVPYIGKSSLSIFGAYRYKAWNGSLGSTDIYTAYGAFIDRRGGWEINTIKGDYLIRIGLAEYQAELYDSTKISDHIKLSLYNSFNTTLPIWSSKGVDLNLIDRYRYSPVPINPGLVFGLNLSTAHFLYDDSSSLNKISLSGGPELTYGSFAKPFFDYTKISLTAGGTIKDGGSPFKFDDSVDLATFGIGFTQQIAGPLVFNSGFQFNIDKGSEYYGNTINSLLELSWRRRAYRFSIYYSPNNQSAGITFSLNDFDFEGSGRPFAPNPYPYSTNILEEPLD